MDNRSFIRFLKGRLSYLRFRYLFLFCLILPFASIGVLDGLVNFRLGQVKEAIVSLDQTVNIAPNVLLFNSSLSRMARATYALVIINGQQSIQQGYPLTTYNNAKAVARETLASIILEQNQTHSDMVDGEYLRANLEKVELLSGQIIEKVRAGNQKEALELANQGGLISFIQTLDLDAEAVSRKDLQLRHSASDQLTQAITNAQSYINYGVLISLAIGLSLCGFATIKLIKDIVFYSTNISNSVLDTENVVKKNGGIIQSLNSAVMQTSATIQELTKSAELVAAQSKKTADLAGISQATATKNQHVMLKSQADMLALESSIQNLTDKMSVLEDELEKVKLLSNKTSELSSESGMLTLNASVLAVNAGEYGVGFSIIAREMQSLSSQIKVLAQEVGDVALSVQRSMGSMQSAYSLNIESGRKTSQSLLQASNAFGEINALADELTLNNVELLKNAISQAAALEQINHAMSSVYASSSEVNAGSDQTGSNMKELARSVEQLRKLI